MLNTIYLLLALIWFPKRFCNFILIAGIWSIYRVYKYSNNIAGQRLVDQGREVNVMFWPDIVIWNIDIYVGSILVGRKLVILTLRPN